MEYKYKRFGVIFNKQKLEVKVSIENVKIPSGDEYIYDKIVH